MDEGMILRELADIRRRINTMQRIGTVIGVDHQNVRLRVEDGPWKSDWLPWLEHRAQSEASWSPPAIGERVIILALCGDAEQAVALAGLPCTDNPVPSNDPAKSVRRFDPNSVFEFALGKTRVEVRSGGIAVITPSLTVNGRHAATIGHVIEVLRGSSKGLWKIISGVGRE